jgi:hypothetical protein
MRHMIPPPAMSPPPMTPPPAAAPPPAGIEDALWILTTVESDVRLKKNITVS